MICIVLKRPVLRFLPNVADQFSENTVDHVRDLQPVEIDEQQKNLDNMKKNVEDAFSDLHDRTIEVHNKVTSIISK